MKIKVKDTGMVTQIGTKGLRERGIHTTIRILNGKMRKVYGYVLG